MPGYILHLTAGVMAAERMKLDAHDANDFLAGCLLPDAVKVKNASHFRSPDRRGRRIEYPEISLFEEKYPDLLTIPVVQGYEYHLFTDRLFFKDFLPQLIEFQGEDGEPEVYTDRVTHVRLKRDGSIIPVGEFFSGEWYYGDFTKMNTWLAEKYDLPVYPGELDMNIKNPGIGEVDFTDGPAIIKELQGYLAVPVSASDELKVFDKEQLTAFLEYIAEKWMEHLHEI